METGFDQTILEQHQPRTQTDVAPVKPLGGKALMRLVAAMERRGLTDLANITAAATIPDEARAQFDELRAQFSAAPSDQRPNATEAPHTAAVLDNYLAALQQAGQPMSPPTPTGPQWRSLGPWTVPNGQTYGNSRVNVSGRVAAIAVHPTNPARVLCGAAHGGVWESLDRGVSWAPRTDFAATLTVGALVYDRHNPNTAYCGTGEGNWWSWLGAGILRSTDGGTSWSTLCTAPFVGQGFYDLGISPADSQRLVAATTGGLYVSVNGGVAWTQRRGSRTWSVSFAPGSAVTAEMLAGCSDGVFRSVDGGTTWTQVALPNPPPAFDRLAVAIAPTNPSIAYAWGARGTTAYLWRRAGNNWTSLPLPAGVSTGQAWYDWYCAAAPDRDNQVYLGAIESYRGDLSGTTWTFTNLSNKGSSGDSIHPDQHAIAFESGNPDTIYIGCDGGLFRSSNRGVNWTSCNNGLVISEIEYLAQDYGSSRFLLAGTQDNGTELWTGNPTWTHVADGDGGDCGVNRTTPMTVFHTYYGMSLERSTTGGNFGSWTNISPPVPSGEGSNFYPPFEACASGGDTIAMGGGALYVSRNNGSNWTRLAFPTAATASAMAIPNINTVYVGTNDGRIYHTTWSGAAWTGLTALTSPRANATVSDLDVDPSNAQRIWATFTTLGGGHVYRSDDGGAHWLDRTSNLPTLPANGIEIDNANSNRIWVALDQGVYQSLDAGATWTNFAASLPNCFIGDLLFQPNARVLRAGTRNRGTWEIPVDGWMTTPVCATQWTGSLNPNETRRWFTWGWPACWHMVWTVMPTTPFAGGAELTWSVAVQRSDAEHATYWITVQNLTNVTVAFEGRYAILSRY